MISKNLNSEEIIKVAFEELMRDVVADDICILESINAFPFGGEGGSRTP